MRFSAFISSALYATSLADIQHERRADSTSVDMAAALSQAAILTSAFPATGTSTWRLSFVTPGGNLLQPPATLIGAIMTAVPASVLVDLAKQGSAFSSIASEFKAGNTPAWYESMPQDVKSYVKALASQKAAGKVNLSATPTPVKWAGTSTEGPEETAKGDVKSSKSKGLAAKPTQAPLVWNVAAAVGLVGVALAL